jgi:hypothetical protein
MPPRRISPKQPRIAPPLPPYPWYKLDALPRFDRALWILGPTGSGKSTLAKQILALPVYQEERENPFDGGLAILECGRFARALAPKGASAQVLAACSCDALDKDVRFFSRKIGRALKAHGQRSQQVLVVGARNPIDFLDHFDVKRDAVLSLPDAGRARRLSAFETQGLEAIHKAIHFLSSNGLLTRGQWASAVPLARTHR